MIPKEVLKKIKRIEITTRHLVNTVLQGEYLSSFKGSGIEFTEAREYTEGDDIRTIDWNVTARMNTPYVKTFVEERELQVIFAVDMSGSLDFGTKENFKSAMVFEFVSALAFTANVNNDRAGFMGFSDEIEKYIPPRKGKKHIMRMIREMLYHRQKKTGTDIAAGCVYLAHLLKKRSTIFLISDFFDDSNYRDALKILRHRHDVIAVVIRDEGDYGMPDFGLLPAYDPETGKTFWMNSGSKKTAAKIRKKTELEDEKLFKMFKNTGIDHMTLKCGEPYINELISFFKKRERRMAR
ncbi:MAG: DUF58 domain-containing protein [Candidatus Goldiibacteriota bacterium]